MCSLELLYPCGLHAFMYGHCSFLCTICLTSLHPTILIPDLFAVLSLTAKFCKAMLQCKEVQIVLNCLAHNYKIYFIHKTYLQVAVVCHIFLPIHLKVITREQRSQRMYSYKSTFKCL